MRLYLEALVSFQEKQAEAEAIETRARMAEAMVFAGRFPEALELADEAWREVEALGGHSVLRSMIQRLRGYALMWADPGAASGALQESLRISRAVHAEFETAQTLLAIGRSRALVHDPTADEFLGEAERILERLGVVRVPDVAIPDGEITIGIGDELAASASP